MDKQIEDKIRGLVSKFYLLRTKEGSEEFDKIWQELNAEIPLEERKEAGRILRESMQEARERKNVRILMFVREWEIYAMFSLCLTLRNTIFKRIVVGWRSVSMEI